MGLRAEVLCAGARIVHVLDSDSEVVVILLGRRAWDVRRFVRHWGPLPALPASNQSICCKEHVGGGVMIGRVGGRRYKEQLDKIHCVISN